MSDSVVSPRARWTAAVVLFLLYVLHTVDRYVISVVIEPIRHAFDLTDTQLGAVGGLAHAIAYSVFVLPVGWLLDRTNRVKLLAGMLGLWSCITAMGAFATGFWYLFIMRMGVGAAESASSPASQSLVASLFPLKERASAMGLVFSGTALGTGLIFAIGGLVAEHWGWRAVFLIAGVPGILLALVMWLTMKEPPRSVEGSKMEKPPPMWKVGLFVFKSPPIIFVTIGSTIAAMSVGSVWTWITPILIRQQDFSLAQAGLIVGVAAGVVKFASTVFSGFLGDWIAKGRIERLWIVPTGALTLSVPVAFGLAIAPSQWVAVVLVMVLGLFLGTHYAAPKTVVMSVAPAHMRGSVAAIEQLAINLIGVAIGPLVTGIISDRLGGENSVGWALAATLSLNLIGALCFWLAMRGAASAEAESTEAETPAPAPLRP